MASEGLPRSLVHLPGQAEPQPGLAFMATLPPCSYTLTIIGGGAYKEENIREFAYDKVKVYNPRINGRYLPWLMGTTGTPPSPA